MKHRHLKPGYEESTTAVAAVLERGTASDWRARAEKLRRAPDGPVADAVLAVVTHHHMYGTSTLWRRDIERLRAPLTAATPAGRAPASGAGTGEGPPPRPAP